MRTPECSDGWAVVLSLVLAAVVAPVLVTSGAGWQASELPDFSLVVIAVAVGSSMASLALLRLVRVVCRFFRTIQSRTFRDADP